MSQQQQSSQKNQLEPEIESYKLSEMFGMVPNYESYQIFLPILFGVCDCAYNVATGEQRF